MGIVASGIEFDEPELKKDGESILKASLGFRLYYCETEGLTIVRFPTSVYYPEVTIYAV